MKLFISLLILTLSALAFGQTTNMPQNGSNSITSCNGIVRDHAGTGNYQNNSNGTLTICSGTSSYISLNFTQFNLEQSYDYLRIYSGVGIGGPLLATLTGTAIPATINIPNTCVTLRFTSDGTNRAPGFQLNYTCIPGATCSDGIQNGLETGVDCGGCSTCPTCPISPDPATLTATANIYNLPCGGGTVNLNAVGNSTTPVLSSNFDLGSPGPGWTFTGSGMFTNPCGPSPSNTTHIWFGNASQHPRVLATNGMDLTCGGTICFDLKFAVQGGSGSCEGPDLPIEGVSLQYSIDCGQTYQNIAYFHPNGNVIGANPMTYSPGINGNTFFTTWRNFCFPIPPAAQTGNTVIRWFQFETSGASFDHWGLDEVVISANNCNPYYYDWAHLPGAPNSPATTVNVTTTSTYNVIYTNGIDDTAYASVTINVAGPINATISTIPVDYCVGVNSGSATFTGNGGSSFSFLINGPNGFISTLTGSPSATLNNLPVGNYTLTTSDGTGCTVVQPFTITSGPFCCNVTLAPTNLSCNVANAPCNGSINAAATNGQGPYMYQWYSGSGTGTPIVGQTNQTIGSLCAGTYTVQISDQSGCTDQATVTLTQPAPLTLSNVPTNILCNGTNNGSILVTASGGSPAYNYTLGGTTNTTGNFTSLPPGNYSISTHDQHGCSATTTTTITQPPVLNYAVNSAVNPTCNLNNGQITVSASGGVGPYNFDIGASNNSTGIFTGLAPGTFNIQITDANGCAVVVYPITLINQANPIIAVDSVSNVTCNGYPTGFILVSASGSTLPNVFNYSLNAGPFTPNNSFSNLDIGTYTITVMDANSCTASVNITITAPPLLSLNSTHTNATCNGVCDGTITNIISGGTAPYTYSLDNGFNFNNPPTTGLCPGTYFILVKDANGCIANQTETITQPTPINFTTTMVAGTCGASNGTFTINTITGGAGGPYLVSYDGSAFAAVYNYIGLPAGFDTVIVQDVSGCQVTQLALINNIEAPFIVNTTVTDNLCFGGTAGSIEANTSISPGGLPPPYNFSINGSPFVLGNLNAGEDHIFAGLANGQYVTAVQDGNGCLALDTLTITSPTELHLNYVSTNILCNGANTGFIQFMGSGGTPGYFYSIDNGATLTNTTGIFSGLPAGTYQPYMEDAHGCSISLPAIVLTEPPAINIAVASTNPNCYNQCDGIVNITASGGVPGYLYSINGGLNFVASNNFTAVCAGTINYTVQDNNNCTASGSVVLANPAQLTLSAGVTNATCGLNNGAINAVGAGGTGILNYNIDGGTFQVASLFSSLPSGTYYLSVMDGNSCSASMVQPITQSGAPVINSVSITNPNCTGGTGSITVNATGGTPIYSYSLNGGLAQASPNFINVPVGPNTVVVTDALNCTASSTFAITQPSPLNMNLPAVTAINCNGNSTGSITLNPTGGTQPYSYSFNGGATIVTSNMVTSVPAGTYNLQVIDANGCIVAANATITQPSAIVTAIAQTNASCFGNCDGQISLNASGGTGALSYNWTSNVAPPNSGNASGLCAGTYNVIITDNNGCSITTPSIVITEPPLVDIVSAIADSVTCFGLSDGVITVIANGASTYSISSPNGTTATNNTGLFTGLPTGYYNVTVSDAIGCEAFTNVMVYEPDVLNLTTTGDITSCYGYPVTYSGFASGGTAPYTFVWNIGATSQDLVYTAFVDTLLEVSVTDFRGCQVGPLPMNITVIPLLAIDPIPNQYVCIGDSVFVTATAQFGEPAYTFNWSHMDPTVDTSGAWLNGASNPSSYWVVVKDLCLHYDSVEVLVYEYQAPTFDLTGPVNGCAPQVETFNIINETSPLSNCTWDFGNGNTGTGCASVTDTYTVPGIYDVIFEYEAYTGCPFDTTFTAVLEIYEVPIIDSINLSDPLCFGSLDGIITVYGSLGTAPYDYQLDLNPTQPLNIFGSLTSGNYTITLSDVNSCFVDSTVALLDPPLLTINTINVVDVLCNGLLTGSITINASGGTTPYQYSFDNGLTFVSNNSMGSLAAGTYNVLVRDTNLCLVDSLGIQISEPPLLEFVSITVTDASCYNVCDGLIDATVNGGVAPYTYSWSSNASTGNVNLTSPLCDGNYDLTVTDAHSCVIDSLSISVAEPPQIIVTSFTVDSITCNGDNDGIIQISATNGDTYELSGPMLTVSNTTGTFNGLIPGTYTITIYDVNLCSIDTTATVYEPLPLTLTNSGDTTVCYATAVVHTATGGGGTIPYVYSWDTGSTGNTLNYTALQDTSLAVTITDANGCTLPTQMINITVLPVLYIDPIANQTICIGDSILTTAVAHDGVGPYVYSWSNLGSGATGTQHYLQGTNNPNSYWITVTDQCNDTDSTEALVYNYIAPTFNLVGPVDGCSPQLENFSIVGASSPISNCSWDFGNSLTAVGCGPQSSNYITPGLYSVTFSYEAFASCPFDTTFTDVLEIYENPIIDSVVIDNPLCFGAGNGVITVYADLGTPAYSYQLGAGPLQLNNDFTNVSAGFYSVTLSDINGCLASSSVNLINPPVLSINQVNTSNTLCFGSTDGEISIVAVGGTAPYQYSFDGGTTYTSNSTMTGLGAGFYHVYVRDTNLCTVDSMNIEVTEPAALVINTVTVVDASCYGFSDGSITLGVIGGTPGYDYAWSLNANTGNSAVANNLSAGDYTVTITDANNCALDSDTITVSSPPQITIASFVTDSVNCFGGNDGSVTINGNNAAFYSITPLSTGVATPNQANSTFNGLIADSYSVQLTDVNGCTFDSSFQIFEPTPVEITSVLITPNLCNGDNTGGITITASGGTGGYTYSFGGSPFGISNSNLTLLAGTYSASVQDAYGCQVDSFGITILQPTAMNVDLVTIIDDSCFNAGHGSISVSISGGTGAYNYTWLPSGANNDTITNLYAGSYDLQVSDDNGCLLDTNNILVGEPTPVAFTSVTVTDASCFGIADGSISIVPSGGTPNPGYDYTWSLNAATGNVATASNLAPGSYSVTITDGNNCNADSIGIVVSSPPQILLSSIDTDSTSCFGGADGEVTFTATNAVSYSITPASTGIPTPNQANSTFTGLFPDTYAVQLTDANGCTFDSSFQIFEPTQLIITNVALTTNLCAGDNNGGITITATGGTPVYTYSFDGGANYNPSNSNLTLAAGTYDISVEDASGCQIDSLGVVVTEPSALQIDSIVVTNASCFNDCDGTITAYISGGSTNYSYDWSSGTADSIATIGQCAGNYDLVVTDANGCMIDSLNIAIAEPPQIVFALAFTDSVNCFGGNDGFIDVVATNATSYTLDGGIPQATGYFPGLTIGNYEIEAFDINGCSIIMDTSIFEPTALVLSVGNDTLVCANTAANLSASATGGTAAYTFDWVNVGIGSNQVVNPSATTYYTVNLTDANGCVTNADSILVTILSNLTTSGLADAVICPGTSAPVTINVLTGVANYSYLWSPAPVSGQGTATANLSNGNYSVTVTDQCGAVAVENVTITNFVEPTLAFTGFTNGCAPHSVSVNANNAGLTNCTWNFGNGSIVNNCGAVNYTYDFAGVYSPTFTFTSADGCVFDTTIVNAITVSTVPVASFTFSPETPSLTYNTVQFTNTSLGGNTYTWSFDGLGSSNQANPQFTFPTTEAQDFNVCLTVSENMGAYTCSDTYCTVLPIEEEFTVYVPNSFTPDNDEHNNTFRAIVLGEKANSFEMLIFDRWGEVVFQSFDHQIGWDGTYQNKICPDGTYIWKIKIKTKNVDDVITKVGHVNLIR